MIIGIRNLCTSLYSYYNTLIAMNNVRRSKITMLFIRAYISSTFFRLSTAMEHNHMAIMYIYILMYPFY